ncbi:MAG TPA: hydroxyacid dehydrogenase [Pyrinomonadaceae bacterium]|nr:hydroxyacid dehydrogenase [Pyrinomonadaceae bacterium]
MNSERQSQADQSDNNSKRLRVLVLASDVLFSHFFPEPQCAHLSEVAEWSRNADREDSPGLREEIAQADILITTWHSPFLHREILGPRPRVRLIAHCGGEVKSRVAEEIFDHVAVTNAAAPMAMPVAEMALALMLTLVRKVPDYAGEMRAGVVRTNEYVSSAETVRGRKLGVVGFGRIGRAFARLVEPLGSELIVTDPCCPEEVVVAHKGKLVELDELLRSCSIVVLAAGLTPETLKLLDGRRLALLPEGAYLINVARGGLIDMDALLSELRTGRITAALDVTDPLEPLPPDHELRRLPNVLLTPHIAAGGIEMRRAIGAVAVEEVVRFCKGEQLQNIVTRDMLATMT